VRFTVIEGSILSLKYLILAPLIGLLSTTAQAGTVQINGSLPPLTIQDRGEVHLIGDEYTYQPWSSQTNPGKLHIVQYLAGTMASSKAYRPFTDEVKATFPVGAFHVTTIVNLDDALWGTGGFVVSEVQSKKRKYPLATLVLDKDGAGRKAWGIEKKGAVLFIIDAQGTILYFTEQPLSESELQEALRLVDTQINPQQ
jgi:YtfJ family uncharacterized protein